MNPERLLQHFDQIAEAPDAVPRLRRFILDLAVRGKLVSQDPNDEPASELLKRIGAEKTKYVRIKQIRNRKADVFASEVSNPFLIPSRWLWARFGQLVEFSAGKTPSRHDSSFWNTGDYPWISISDMTEGGLVVATTKETVSQKAKIAVFKGDPTPAGTLLMSFKLTIGRVSRLAVPAFHNEAIISIYPHIQELDPYLFRFLSLFSMSGSTKNAIKGATLNRESLGSLPIPLPPLAEQHRIVAKVDNLMALCDELEAAQAKREKRRDRLVATTLHGLNNGDVSSEPNFDLTFEDSARFYFNHLPRLTTRPEHIHQLRQTILRLAVRGKLVPQDPDDEPASELIARIRSEKVRWIKENKVRSELQLTTISEASVPFALPRGWAWVRFPDLGTFGRGKSKHRPRNDPSLFEGGTHLFVQTGDVARSKGVIETFTGKYNDIGLAQSAKWPKGTLCITIAANIADSGILGFDACFPDSVVGFIPVSLFPNARYFEYFIRTVKAELLEFAPATAQKNINLGILNEVLIPLPPLAAQHRIVAKVDNLMALCNELESRLTKTATTRRQLLDAALYEALNLHSGIQ